MEMADVVIDDGGTSDIINPTLHQKSTLMYSSLINQKNCPPKKIGTIGFIPYPICFWLLFIEKQGL